MSLNYDGIVRRIEAKQPVTFSRFGDGEFNCIFGKKGSNCDGHQYFPKLGTMLRQILESRPPYTIGIQSLAKKVFKEGHEHSGEFVRLTRHYQTPADIFHRANQSEERLSRLFKALSTRKVILVGPAYLRALTAFPFELEEVPEKNCFLRMNETIWSCYRRFSPGVVFLFCCGMPAKAMIHCLWLRYRKGTFLDLGSALDPHVGRVTRKYHKAMLAPK